MCLDFCFCIGVKWLSSCKVFAQFNAFLILKSTDWVSGVFSSWKTWSGICGCRVHHQPGCENHNTWTATQVRLVMKLGWGGDSTCSASCYSCALLQDVRLIKPARFLGLSTELRSASNCETMSEQLKEIQLRYYWLLRRLTSHRFVLGSFLKFKLLWAYVC